MSEIRSGDLLWHMCGTRQNDKIKWEAEPRVIELENRCAIPFLNEVGRG